MLARKSMCVTELADALGENVSTVSQRLKLLRSERIAKSHRDGKHIYYALADQHIAELVMNGFEHASEPARKSMPVRNRVKAVKSAPPVKLRKTSR